jgi:hypothetical protein
MRVRNCVFTHLVDVDNFMLISQYLFVFPGVDRVLTVFHF